MLRPPPMFCLNSAENTFNVQQNNSKTSSLFLRSQVSHQILGLPLECSLKGVVKVVTGIELVFSFSYLQFKKVELKSVPELVLRKEVTAVAVTISGAFLKLVSHLYTLHKFAFIEKLWFRVDIRSSIHLFD